MVAYTMNHETQFDNKKPIQWNQPMGYSGMSNPTYEEPMMKNFGQWPMPQNNGPVYGPMPYQPQPQEMPCGPQFQPGWSKDFVKQCGTPMHQQYGCPPMPYNCNYDMPMTREILTKVPVPVPTPVPVPVQVPVQVPVPVHIQVPVPVHMQPQLAQPMMPQGQWPMQWQGPQQWQQEMPMPGQWAKEMPLPQQWTKNMPPPQWIQEYWAQQQMNKDLPPWTTQHQMYNQPQPMWNKDMPFPGQWNKDLKFPIHHDLPIHHEQPIPMQQQNNNTPTGQRHTQVTTTRW